MLRLFIAVDVPAALQRAAAALCAEVRGARLTKPEQLHVTLRFLGATPEERLAELRDRLARVEASPFRLAVHGAGVFPPQGRRVNVLWLGLEPPAPLSALKQEIDRALDAPPAFSPEEKREFRPHLTLARFSRRPDASLTRFLEAHAGYRSEDWPVDGFRLYQSTLLPSGARHEIVAAYPLAGICRER
jgi:2'-5' RNA ligase